MRALIFGWMQNSTYGQSSGESRFRKRWTVDLDLYRKDQLFVNMAERGSGRTGREADRRKASRCGLGLPGNGALRRPDRGVRYRTSKERCVADRVESTRVEWRSRERSNVRGQREEVALGKAGFTSTTVTSLNLWFQFSAI